MYYINLTAGMEWKKADKWQATNASYIRLQSTLLEQKHYGKFILSVPADMLMRLALGEDVMVLDASRKSRGSRACWQGLSFLEFVCGRMWGFRVEVNPNWGEEFEKRWRELGKREKAWVGYYREVWEKRGGRVFGFGGKLFRLRWECLSILRERGLGEMI